MELQEAPAIGTWQEGSGRAPRESIIWTPMYRFVTTHETTDFSAGERFDVRRRIGAGGMGVVYEAFDRERDMRVALKTLPRLDPELLYRFKQEFRNLSDVSHGNLVLLYELFSRGEDWFFSMEYIEGLDFLDYVRAGDSEGLMDSPTLASPGGSESASREQTLDFSTDSPRSGTGSAGDRPATGSGISLTEDQYSRLRPALRQLVEGVQALHDAGKLHRDIKPSNVLVTEDGRVVLLDFGLSTGLREAIVPDRDRRIMGTLGYMAPEQAMGSTLTPACDWFAVGAMLYEALTGQLPYESRSLRLLREKHKSEPLPVTHLSEDVPDDLSTLCHALLRRQPKERPSGREILGLLGGTGTELDAPRVTTSEAPFIGRGAQIAALQDALSGLRDGRPVTVFLNGTSGVGKSFLIEHFLGKLSSDSSTVVLSGRCYEAESVPYKGLDSLIDALARELVTWPQSDVLPLIPRDAQALTRVFPVLKQVSALADAPGPQAEVRDERELRRRAFGGLRELLARLGDRRRLVLTIDDLQWGDMDSAALLVELLQPPDAPVLLLIGSYRSEYADRSPSLKRLLAGFAEHEGLDRRVLDIEPLSLEESRELALVLLSSEGGSTALADRIARESHGVPFFVHELVQFVLGRGESESPAKEGITLDEVLQRRFASLPEGARQLLEAVSLAGRPLRQRDAYSAAQLELSDLSAVSYLRAKKMVRSTGMNERDTIEPYHDRIREGVISSIPSAEMAVRHGRLAQTLEQSGIYDAEMVGVHFEGAGNGVKAAMYFGRAADQAAATLAFNRAASLYRRSLDLNTPEPDERHELLIGLGDALANAGRSVEAAKVFQEALKDSRGDEALDLQRRAAFQFCISGHMREGREALADLLGRLGMNLPQSPMASLRRMLWYRLRLRLRGLDFKRRQEAEISDDQLRRCDTVWSASIGLSMVDIIDGAAFQARALLLALDAGEPYRISRALSYEATHVGNSGIRTWERTQSLIRQATALAEESGQPYATAMAIMSDGAVHFFLGRWNEAIERLERAALIFREQCTGVFWELDSVHNFLLWALYYKGEYVDMQRRMQPLLREATGRGDLYFETSVRTYDEPIWRLVHDEPVLARQGIQDAVDAWAVDGFHLQSWEAMIMLTHCDLYEGETERALARMQAGWRDTRKAQLHRSQTLRILTLHMLGEAALAACKQQGGKPLRTARRLCRRLAREGVDWADAFSTVLRAGIEAKESRSSAASLFEEAAEKFDEVSMATFAAASRRRAGELRGGTNGKTLIEMSDAWLASQEVADAERFCRAHVAAVPTGEGS